MSKAAALDAINSIENHHPDDMTGYWLSLIRVYILLESIEKKAPG